MELYAAVRRSGDGAQDAERSRSGVRSRPRISPVRRSNTRPSGSASAYARRMASRARESLRARAAAESAGPADFGLGGDRRGRTEGDLVVDLPHSDEFPAETTEAFCEHTAHTTTRRGGADSRVAHAGLQRAPVAYLFDALRAPREGQRQRTVEGLGYARRNFFVQRGSRTSAVNVAGAGYGGTPRRSGNGSPATARRCCRYRRSRMTPAIHGRRGSPHCRWCATAATTTPCRPTATGRCW